MPEWNPIPTDDAPIRAVRRSFYNAGVDDWTNPPAQDPDSFDTLENVITGVRPRIKRRWGTTLFANLNSIPRRIFETHFSNGRNRFVTTTADQSGSGNVNNWIEAVNENGSVVTFPYSIFMPSANAHHPEAATSRNMVYFTDGISADLLKWDTNDDPTATTVSPDTSVAIPSVTNWGIVSPTVAPTIVVTGSSDVTLTTGRSYCYAWRNSLTGHVSGISPFSESTGAIENSQIAITYTDPTDPQCDQVVIMATADGGAQDTLYQLEEGLQTIGEPDLTISDTDPEEDLVNRQIWAELGPFGQVGLIGNEALSTILEDGADAVAAGKNVQPVYACAHRGRMYVLQGHFLFWSKTQAELTTSTALVAGRWEEAFNAANQTPLSTAGGETGTAIESDGVNLYIGTNRSIYVLSGDDPGINPPRALFQEVGVINNASWKVVYHEGQKLGAIWLTPDKRVIWTNFNSYKDIGHEIQTALSAMGNVQLTATATFIADGAHELYLLSPGNTDTTYVYNVKTGKWVTWTSAYSNDIVYAHGGMYDSVNVRALPIFSTTSNRLYRWNTAETGADATVYDHASGGGEVAKLPTPVITTNWLDFNDPEAVKVLINLFVQTADTGLTVTIYAANSDADFESPVTLNTRTFTADLFGTLRSNWADVPTRHRFYKLAFSGYTAATTNLLSYLAVEYAPITHR